MDNMKNGIPCNETRHTLKAERNRIDFNFVTTDGNTPSSCSIGIGDMDPLTGETITDMTFFEQYHKMVDHDIYTCLKDIRRPLTPGEKKQRAEKKEALIAEFEEKYGYRPSASDIHWLVDDFMPDLYTASIERYRDEEDTPESDRISGLGIPCCDPFGDAMPEDVRQLREFADSLTGRYADIYEFLLVKHAGGQKKLSLKEIADKWGISPAQAYKDKEKIIRMIRETVGTP